MCNKKKQSFMWQKCYMVVLIVLSNSLHLLALSHIWTWSRIWFLLLVLECIQGWLCLGGFTKPEPRFSKNVFNEL